MKGREPSTQLQRSRWWADQASREEMESGVVVFDKRRTSVVYGLLFTAWLNTRVVREEVTYENTYGASSCSLSRSRWGSVRSSEKADSSFLLQATRSRSGWCAPLLCPSLFEHSCTPRADARPRPRSQAFELSGLPYHLDREYAGIIGQLTHPDTKAHSIDTFIQSDHLFHLDHRASPLRPSSLSVGPCERGS